MIRQQRIQRGLTQKQLAEQVGLPRQRISEYERGRGMLSDHALQVLAQVLNSGDLIAEEWFLSAADRRRLSRKPRWEIQVDEGSTWATLPPRYASIYSTFEPTYIPPLAFKRLVRCDSSLEILVWVLLLELGFRPRLASPVALGFREFCLADSAGRALGHCLKAAFYLKEPGLDVICWPQITLERFDLHRRVDGLILTRTPHQTRWSVLEIDGKSHNSEWDQKQDQRLGLKVHRFPEEDVLGLRVGKCLMEQLRTAAGEAGPVPKR